LERSHGEDWFLASVTPIRLRCFNFRMSSEPVDSMLGKMETWAPTFHVAAAIVAWPLVDGWK